MTDATTWIPQSNTTNPIIPTDNQAQDLQINLEESPKTKIEASTWDLPPETNIDLNLDLNVSDAPKDDDRLKIEDKKNEEFEYTSNNGTMSERENTEAETQEIFTPRDETIHMINEPISEQPDLSQIFTPADDAIQTTSETTGEQSDIQWIFTPTNEVMQMINEPINEQANTPQIFTPTDDVMQMINEPINEQTDTPQIFTPTDDAIQTTSETTREQSDIQWIFTPADEVTREATSDPAITQVTNTEVPKETEIEQTKASKTIEEVQMTSPKIIGEDVSETTSLKDDMKIIDELEWHGSAGGLAKEAIIAPQEIKIEAPKTFDLDTMLGNPTPPPTIEIPKITIPVSTPTPAPAPTPIPMQEFTLPTPTTQVPVQAVSQVILPHTKKIGMKVFLLVIMFIGLWFTTFFILKTMYPLEFWNIFNQGTSIHASASTTGTETIEPEIIEPEIIQEATGDIQEEIPANEATGTDIPVAEEISGTIDTNNETTTGDEIFWELGELGDLGTTVTETPAQTNISKLTDYINQGNDFLAQGKVMNNNTIIKYSLYITKKSAVFLEDIANGKEINNLSGYFAQFDQYIVELQKLVGQPATTPPTFWEENVSTTQQTNDAQDMTSEGFWSAQ